MINFNQPELGNNFPFLHVPSQVQIGIIEERLSKLVGGIFDGSQKCLEKLERLKESSKKRENSIVRNQLEKEK